MIKQNGHGEFIVNKKMAISLPIVFLIIGALFSGFVWFNKQSVEVTNEITDLKAHVKFHSEQIDKIDTKLERIEIKLDSIKKYGGIENG